MSKSMAKEKFDAEEFISSLFHYAHDFNYNHMGMLTCFMCQQIRSRLHP